MQLIKVLNISDCLSRKIRWDRIKDNKLFSFNNLQVWISIFFNVTARRCTMKEESFSTTFVLSESFCHSLLSEAFYMFSFYDEPENHHCTRKIFSEVMTSPGYLYWRKNTKKITKVKRLTVFIRLYVMIGEFSFQVRFFSRLLKNILSLNTCNFVMKSTLELT